MSRTLFFAFALFGAALPPLEAGAFEVDTVDTSKGPLKIHFIGHGTLFFEFGGKVIHVDPVGQFGDYAKMPKADIILLTHDHPDHLDVKAIETIRTEKTRIILTQSCAGKIKGGTVMKNGDVETVESLRIEAVPAYNIVHMMSAGVPFHPKGRDNGYVITFGDKRVYVAADTENTPEVKGLKNIDIAFLPMNLPYTMTPQMVADAAKAFKPRILYPYHYGDTDVKTLIDLMKDVKDVEVRIRKMN